MIPTSDLRKNYHFSCLIMKFSFPISEANEKKDGGGVHDHVNKVFGFNYNVPFFCQIRGLAGI